VDGGRGSWRVKSRKVSRKRIRELAPVVSGVGRKGTKKSKLLGKRKPRKLRIHECVDIVHTYKHMVIKGSSLLD
jgi:hypothetical protein